ncbi:serine/threonine protein kinase [Myxococcota bacterium]|nr:serine/threonine protein kinase [Myxococcota bacterium]
MWKCIECGFQENEAGSELCSRCQAPRDPKTFEGEQIGQWRLEKPLGEGGMAVVFLARHVMLGSKVAIKLLRSDLTNKREVIERFRTEALAASHLRHENVIQVMDFGFQKGIGFYMVLEFLEGNDLEAYLTGQPMPPRFVKEIAKQIARGLQAAHESGIIHRDLKPSNIFLVPREGSDIPQVKILDFGIAKIQESELLDEENQKLTRTGTVLGTPFYLSPEQLTRRQGVELGASVDIYAFGVILFQLLAGKLPIEEPSIAEQMVAILTRKAPMLGEVLPPFSNSALELFLQRALSKSPQSRPATVAAFWEELDQAMGVLEDAQENTALRQVWEKTYKDILEKEQPPSLFYRLRWVFALLALLVVGGGSWWLASIFQTPPPPPPPPRLTGIPQFKELGIQDFQAGKFASALQRFDQIVSSKRWTSSSKDFDPKVYRLMATALFEAEKDPSKKPAFAALQFFQLYLKQAKSFDAGEKEALEKNVQRLEQRVAASESATKELLRALGKHLKSGDDNATLGVLDTAFALQKKEALGRLDYGPDVSLSSAYTRTAELLQQRFPGLSLALLKKASQIRLPPKQQRKLVLRYEEMKRAIQKRQDDGLKELQTALQSNDRKQTQASLRRLLSENTDDPSIYRRIRSLLLRDYYQNPQASLVLLRLYRDEIKLTLRPDAQAWYRRLVGKELPSVPSLDQTIKAGQFGIKGVVAHKRARAFLEKGEIKKATPIFSSVPKLLKRSIETPESLLTPLFQRLIHEANNAQSSLQQADETWKKIAAMAESGDLLGARKSGDALLATLKDNPAAVALYKKRLEDQKAEYSQRCERLAQSAQRSLGRGGLRDAEKYYEKGVSCWKQLAAAEPEQAKRHEGRVASSLQWQERLQKAAPLLDQLRKDREALRNTSANQGFDAVMPLLDGSPAKRVLKQEHLAWGQQRLRYMRFRQKGDQYAQNERWEQAVYEYKQAQKLFPRAHDARNFQRRILECECNSGVTWEICKQFKRAKPR